MEFELNSNCFGVLQYCSLTIPNICKLPKCLTLAPNLTLRSCNASAISHAPSLMKQCTSCRSYHVRARRIRTATIAPPLFALRSISINDQYPGQCSDCLSWPTNTTAHHTSDHFDQSECSVLIQTSVSLVVHERHTVRSVLFLFSLSFFLSTIIVVALVWVRIFPFAFKERPVPGVTSR